MATAVTREVVIRNRLGLHARAAAQFVKTAERFQAEITVGLGRHKVNGKSIMGLLMLAASEGTARVPPRPGPLEVSGWACRWCLRCSC